MTDITRRYVLGFGIAAALGVGYATYTSTSEFLASARVYSDAGTSPTESRYLDDQPRLSDGAGTLWATLLNTPSQIDERVRWGAVPDGLEGSIRLDDDSEFLVVVVAVLSPEADIALGRPRVDGDAVRYGVERDEGGAESDELVFHYTFEQFKMNYPYPEPTRTDVTWAE